MNRGTPAQEDIPAGLGDSAGREDAAEAEECALVAAAINGDTSAFAQLYRTHAPRVYRYCYYRTGNRAVAEDLTQQVFLQAWKAIHRHRPDGRSFAAWLLAIGHNLAVSYFRKAREASSEELEVLSSEDDDPEACAMSSVACDAVRRAVLRLSPDRQRVITLRFIEGFTVTEVAGAMGTSEDNVRTIQRRALVDLRNLLETEDPRVDQKRGHQASNARLSIARKLVSQLRGPETPN